MGTLLAQLLAFPPHPAPSVPIANAEYDQKTRTLVKTLRETNPNKLSAPVSGADTILDIVNPATHSLPYLYAILASLDGKDATLRIGSTLWQKVLGFINTFDPVQVRYTGAEFRKLLETVAGCANQDPVIAIEPLQIAILRLDPSGSTLTSSHTILLRLCLKYKTYSLAQPVIDRAVYHVPTPNSRSSEKDSPNIPLPCSAHTSSSTFITAASGLTDKLDYHDHLLYFLYAGMICIGLWSWKQALSHLEIAITAPVSLSQASMIQVEAYKKWSLVNLLVHGKPQAMPRNVSGNVAKQFRALAKAYDVIGEAFKNPDPAKLRAEIQAGPFVQDSNYSLVLLVISAHQRFKVLALSETYASVPLPLVLSLAFPPSASLGEVETYIQNLISTSQLPGASLAKQSKSGLNSTQTYLRFATRGALPRTEEDLYADLAMQRQKVDRLGEYIHVTQRKVETSKEYVDAVKKMRKQEAKSQKDSQNDQNFQSQIPGAFDDEMVADM